MAEQKLTLEYSAVLKFDSGKSKWDVKLADYVNIDGQPDNSFVKLRRCGLNFGFPRLVFEHIGKDKTERSEFTLAASIGYMNIQHLRNEAQRADLQAGMIASLPEWQRASAKIRPKRESRCAKIHQSKGFLSVIIPAVGGHPAMPVDIARPLCSTDDLVVRMDEKGIEHIIRFIADGAFDADIKRSSRNPDLPKGVYKRGNAFVVRSGNSKKYKKAASIEDALRLVSGEGMGDHDLSSHESADGAEAAGDGVIGDTDGDGDGGIGDGDGDVTVSEAACNHSA